MTTPGERWLEISATGRAQAIESREGTSLDSEFADIAPKC
jgi:hypothetical protein